MLLGMIRTEMTGADLAEEMEKERRCFQLHMCDYLLRVNEVKTRKGVELLQHLVEFYHAQNSFFQDGIKTIGKKLAYFPLQHKRFMSNSQQTVTCI